ncbi:MAG: heme biosynthesis HemY N-terminal domain-containing protein [Burkholderiales bacterium]
MKALLWTIAIFALAVGLVVAARYNDGYVLVVLPPYRVEIALNLLLLLLAGAFVLFYSLVRLVTTAVQMPARVREYRLARRRETAQSTLLAALQAYFEGRYAKAEQSASQSSELGAGDRLSLVLAARAAHELRAYERRDAYIERIAQDAAEDDALRIITQAELLVGERRAKDALEVLQELPRKHTAALKLELKAQQQMRQWDQVAALVSELERRGVFDTDQASKLRTHALAESVRRKALDVHALDEVWRKLPDAQKRETPLAVAAAQSYIAANRRSEAQQIIEQSLEHAWDSELVALYPDCLGTDTVRQIERAETWLEEHPGDAALLLTLGRLCARQGLWGKAESYLEASVSVEPTYTGHVELARLHEKLGNTDAARRHYRESLDLALAELKKGAHAARENAESRSMPSKRPSTDPMEIEQRR